MKTKWMRIIVLVALCGIAQATVVDFSVMGINSVDITIPINPAGVTIDEINFQYDDYGSGVDFANVDSAGIWGTTSGALYFNFDTPATTLTVNFSLMGAIGSDEQGLVLFLSDSIGNYFDPVIVPSIYTPWNLADPGAGGDSGGTASFSGGTFTQATLFFSTAAPYFSVDSVNYEAIPEPATFLLFGLGGMGAWMFRRNKAKSKEEMDD